MAEALAFFSTLAVACCVVPLIGARTGTLLERSTSNLGLKTARCQVIDAQLLCEWYR